MNEDWKDIPGYEGLYQASTFGRIRTCEGKVTSSSRYPHRVWKQRVMKLKCTRNKKGRNDYRVELWKSGEHRTWLVARLIAMTWCDGYQEDLTVNHIDGNCLNNRSENLEWVSLADNIRLGFQEELYPQKACVLISEDGNRTYFRSQCEASRSIGRNNQYIAGKKLRGGTVRAKDGRKYRVEFE